jgi:hypothetical protein
MALASALALGSAHHARANVTLAIPFSNHMVLQRGVNVPIWGTADAGEAITVSFRGQTKTTTAGTDRKWMIRLDPGAEGGPFELVAQGKNKLTVTDVLMGEVWLGGGQSNMDMPISHLPPRSKPRDRNCPSPWSENPRPQPPLTPQKAPHLSVPSGMLWGARGTGKDSQRGDNPKNR